MSLSKEERKVRLLEVAEQLLDRMLSEEGPGGEIMLEDIERAALRVGQGLQGAVAADIASNSEQAEAVKCSKCGKKMVYQGLRSRPVVSEAGEITIQRAYYYCRGCKSGSYPPG